MVEKECSVVHTDKIEKVFSEITDDLSLVYMAEIFQCFADPTRLKIINALLVSELCVCDLTKILQMTQPAVSHHLKHLRHIRVVKFRRDGKSILYSLDDDHIRSLFDICKTHLDEFLER